MSDTAWGVLSAFLSVQFTAIVFLGIGVARLRERVARTEQQLKDMSNGRTQRRTR